MAIDAPIETDALIIGAGPAGLFLAFELGLLDIKSQIVDSLPQAGGQCIELYPDKPIYDIPGLPSCSARELIANLLRQVEPFAPRFHFDQEVALLQKRDDGRFDVETSAGTRFIARTVFIAAGAGSFQARVLKVAGIDRHTGEQLLYRVPADDALAGRDVVIVGGGDDALTAVARASAAGASSVTLLHRREVLDASETHMASLHALVQAGRVRFIASQIVNFQNRAAPDDDRLASVDIITVDEATHRLAVEMLLVFLGVSPRLGPIANWGLAMERRQVAVNAATFETGTPCLYAIGDVITYPGKRKLILCGFHEATLAAFAAAERLFPDERILLQYTTTSPKLHALLGVTTPAVE